MDAPDAVGNTPSHDLRHVVDVRPVAHAEGLVQRLRAAGCVFAEDEARLLRAAACDTHHLEALTQRRIAGEPLEYVLGWAEFAGLRIAVAAGVFVPRPRSEFLVAEAEAALPSEGALLDLCCGSGALGAALAARAPDVSVTAADSDAAAVACARRNLPAGCQVFVGDLFEPLPHAHRGRFDVIIANAPYVPTAEIRLLPPEARSFEALAALDGGSDGLTLHRRIVADAPAWLASGGKLLIECSERQAPALAELFAGAGLLPTVRHDAALDATVVSGALASSLSGRGGG